MKKFKAIAVLAIAFCFLLGTTSVYGYDNIVTVSAGNGSFDIDPGTGTTAKIDVAAGTVTVGNTTATLSKLPDKKAPKDSKYFVVGMKIAGYDNGDGSDYVFTDTVNINDANAPESYKNKDTQLVVAYGLKSNMVKYTVSYVDQKGTELLASENHYGVIGQKPVVSYKYVEGFLPNAYKAAKTLTADPAQNVITFSYSPIEAAEGNIIYGNNTNTANANANAANGNANANAAAGNAAPGNAAAGNAAPGTATIGDNATPQAINDQDTPLAGINGESEEGSGGSAMPYVVGGVIAAAVLAAIAAFLARRKTEAGEFEAEAEAEA